MKTLYEVGAVRWKRWAKQGDVRSYRPSKGWEVEAMLIDAHPITGRETKDSQWWIREEYVGGGA